MRSHVDMKRPQPLFTPFKTKRNFEEISDQIKELIYSGVLKTGDKLPCERELAVQFNIGRMVIREALRTLEESGLIYIKHGSSGGAFIKSTDSSVITKSISDMIKIGNVKLADLTEVRWGIEKIVLELVVKRISNKDMASIEKNIQDSERKISKGISTLDEDLEFHALLARSSRNPLFDRIVESVLNLTKTFVATRRRVLHHDKILDCHKEIYRAVKERNLTVAQEKMQAHLLAMLSH